MRPYSQDLRDRIIATVARGEDSLHEITARFLVDVSTIVRLLKRHRQTGSVEPSPHAGGRRPALGDDDLRRLQELVREQPDAPLKELRDVERDTPEGREKRATFLAAAAAGINPERLVFVDETGTNTSMTRPHGLRLSAATAPFVLRGATYAEEVLAPQLRPDDVVIWDILLHRYCTIAIQEKAEIRPLADVYIHHPVQIAVKPIGIPLFCNRPNQRHGPTINRSRQKCT